MNTKRYWYAGYDRGLETIAIWGNRAPLLMVGELSLGQHAGEVLALSQHLLQCDQAAQVLETMLDGRDAAAATLRDLCMRGCRLVTGTLPAGDPAIGKVQAVYAVRGQSFRAVQDKCSKLVAVWEAVNARRAALQPAQPALLIGTTDVASFGSQLGNYGQVLSQLAVKEDLFMEKKTVLRLASARVDRNNKRWYKAWQGQFAKGSPELAALSQIDTGPSLTVPGQGVFLPTMTLPNQAVKLNFGAARAKTFTLLHQGPGQSAYTVLADGLTAKSFEHAVPTPGRHSYKVTGQNSAGTGAESGVLEVTVAQQAVA